MADKDVPTATLAVTNLPPSTTASKKKVKSAKPKAVAKATHPSTADMVTAAIVALKERGGSSLQAIKKYIAGTYKLDTDKLAPFIKKYIRAAVASEALIQVKGKGASGSFKLPTGKTEGPKKTVTKTVKKVASPKKSVAVKKPAKKIETATGKPISDKKSSTTKKAAEKPKKDVKPVAAKAVKSPKRANKSTKSPTTKPKAPKPKKIAAPKTAKPKVAAASKK